MFTTDSPAPPVLRRVTALLLVAALPSFALTACGEEKGASGDAAPTTASSSGSTSGATVADWTDPDAGVREGAPTISEPDGPAPTELVVDDLTTGDGATVAEGTVAIVDYVGANFSNGKVFDASYGRSPFPVSVGAGRVIPGWDKGLVGMKVGGSRQLTIPPDLGYGDQANGDIPANETLIFIIELRAVLERPTVEGVPGGTVSELAMVDIDPGFGDDVVEAGDQVMVHYVGVHGATGEQFDASWDGGEPFPLTVGNGEVIAGWDQGLVGMKLGGRRRLEIPGSLAYGPDGRPPTIGPDETLVFVVDVVGLA